ncbi:hypothetical protein A9995_04020 [Erythrobacter sp. QSSC1-22B]|uniref:DUF2975 domain-containing protein n=1 Tax=Erythrobacter sp. QSSC1-22B TaxID=1860125 RepID=UPI000805331E|nr:DUF2975 domain-containing protein [Erythrobacter sp. QSSC1-22B]OBX19737.1 hypothetical protein A9995_04020 [Erythrobacter sp. QSSC1-22B]
MSTATPPPFKRDLLLAAAKVLLALLIGILIFAMAMVGIGIGAVLSVGRPTLLAEIAAAGAPQYAYWVVIALLLLVEGMLFLGLRFLMELRRIVVSVEEGDPFRPANAERLARMGWLALAIWLAGIPVSLIGAWLTPYAVAAGEDVVIQGDFGVESLFLILTLFILARVFRQGAAMRDDLEGTV